MEDHEGASRRPLGRRQRLAISHLCAGKTISDAAKLANVSRTQLNRWRRQPGFALALEESLEEIHSSLQALVLDGFRVGLGRLLELAESEDQKIALGAASELVRRCKPLDLQQEGGILAPASAAQLQGVASDEDWLRRLTEPSVDIRPHPAQLDAILSTARFVAAVAGVQSGKTAGLGLACWRRILEDEEQRPGGFYWLLAPDTVIGEVMQEHFQNLAPPGWLSRPSGPDWKRTWTLKSGGRVQFRSAERADRLVARSVRGAWLDEFTLMRPDVWRTSVRQRLAATGGWALFSGTPRGRNWAWEDVWRRTLEGDEERDTSWAGFTWPSSENPLITQAEVEEARRQLPSAYFRREWEASWEAFHGQVYEEWDDARMVRDFNGADADPPEGSRTVAGVDWGFSKPGCLIVARRMPDRSWRALWEVHEAKRLPDWWLQKFAEARALFGVQTFWADPEEPARIAEARKAGLPFRAARNEVGPGIREVASTIAQRLLLVSSRCQALRAQLASYSWKRDRQGEETEEPAKVNDHAADALRYALFSEKRAGRQVRAELASGAGDSTSSRGKRTPQEEGLLDLRRLKR